jgi:soluble lytic murein transglycosylase-like protein
MEILDLYHTEHPPHLPQKGRQFSFSRLLIKSCLFLFILSVSIYLPNHVTELQKRDASILEILSVLDKRKTDLASVAKEDLAEAIYDESMRYSYDPKLTMALIDAESNFFNWAVSKRGAKGLMQIMPEVAQELAQQLGIEWMGDRTLFNPDLNVRMGLFYLSQLAKDFNDLGTALTAYNYGPNYVKALLDKKEKLPTDYYKTVLSAYRAL